MGFDYIGTVGFQPEKYADIVPRIDRCWLDDVYIRSHLPGYPKFYG
jgi:hypothetical protein